MRNRALHNQVADKLRQRISQGDENRLPSIAALAREERVSVVTMWKAVRSLVQEGLVECGRGTGISVAGRPQRKQGGGASADALFEKIRALVTNGTYHVSDPLPKIDFFTIGERRSRSTVVCVIRRLEQEGLLHKRGKRWIVGPASTDAGGTTVSRPGEGPVALFLVLNQVYWKGLFQSSFTSPFISGFLSELRRHHIGLSLATTHIPPNEMGALPTGPERVQEIIRSLGRRYQGAIMVYYSTENSQEMIPILSSFERPIVQFNSTNEPSGHSGTTPRRKRGGYYYLHLDEPAAVRLLLDHLSMLGHRVIGVPVYSAPGYEWTQRRIAAIRTSAARHFPAMRIITVEQDEPWWGQLGPDSSTAEFMAALGAPSHNASDVSRLPSGLRNTLLDKTPSLASLARHKGLTAIVALNSDLARKYYVWLKLAGIDVPRRLSLISFDDTPESVTFPITTVDFGFARLGYLAAHVLIGDIPVKTDGEGNVPGSCELVDRGSVRSV